MKMSSGILFYGVSILMTSCLNGSQNNTDIPNEAFYLIMDSSETTHLDAIGANDIVACGPYHFVPIDNYQEYYESGAEYEEAYVKFGFGYDRQEPGYDYYPVNLSKPQIDSLAVVLNDMNKVNFHTCDSILFIHQSELDGMATSNWITIDFYSKMSYPSDTLIE